MFEAIEKFSVVKTLQAIESANVVLLLLDATQGVTDQDAHIAGYIVESGRAVVVAINKWDAVDEYQRQMLERSIETRLPFLKFASFHHISAKKRQGLGPLWSAIAQAHKSATSLRASGWHESTHHRGSRKLIGACHGCLQALP